MNPITLHVRAGPLAAAFVLLLGARANAVTVQFFNSLQIATPVETGVNVDAISSSGYLFTYTRDKLFTGGAGQVLGRTVRVPWPQGVEAQAITEGPNAPGKPEISIARVDGGRFDLTAFSAKLLANTYGTGGQFEIMPQLGGEDAWNDPSYFEGSGFGGQTFSYNETPDPWGRYSTSALKNFDAYKISIFVDFAWTALTLVDDSAGPLGDFDDDADVDGADFLGWQRGESPNSMSTVDLADWQENFGAPAVSASVAEPSTLAILVILIGPMALRRLSPNHP
jgi:hypothetical protein